MKRKKYIAPSTVVFYYEPNKMILAGTTDPESRNIVIDMDENPDDGIVAQ